MTKTFIKTLENGKFMVVNEAGENTFSKSNITFNLKWEAEQAAQQSGSRTFDFQGEWVEVQETSLIDEVVVRKNNKKGSMFIVTSETATEIGVKVLNPNNGRARANAKEVIFNKDQMEVRA